MAGLEGKSLDRYQLQRLIGRGGMADVYEGYDPHFDRMVAVKVFKREDEEMLRRFVREARLMASLHNPHLVAVYDTGESEVDGLPRYYIVMPFMEGGTLRARIRRTSLSLPEACRNLKDIAAALDYIHQQGIIHRDIKSSNVLLDADGRCYLSDFGIARTMTDATQLTSTGNVLGTVDYVAPELFEVNHRADAHSDLYSLGVLLFEMVTGQLPFAAENQIALVSMHMNKRPPAPSSIVQNIPPLVEQVIFKALEKKPEQRYASATELANAFCRAIAAANRTREVVPLQTFPEDGHLRPDTHKIVLPPLEPLAPNTQQVRRSPLTNAPETVSFVPSSQARPASSAYPRPVGPPTLQMPRESIGTPLSPPPRRTGPNRALIVAIIALITLLLVVVPVIYVLATHSGPGSTSTATATSQTQGATTGPTPSPTPSPTATPNATATAQAIAAVTATARAQATASAIAHATATAQAQASATAGVIQTATAGKPVYEDTLNNPNNPQTKAANWDGIDGNDSHCIFSSDGYHVTEGVNLVNFHGCRETGNTYQNGAIAVDIVMLSGHSGGLFFRLSADTFGNYSGYLFEVDSQGNYKISTVSGTTTTPLQGHDWSPTPALKQGYNVKNTLEVIMRNNSFLFYINGAYLTSATDATFANEGEIGFLATTQGTKADVVYTNVRVYPQA